jgi:hypothetical protein
MTSDIKNSQHMSKSGSLGVSLSEKLKAYLLPYKTSVEVTLVMEMKEGIKHYSFKLKALNRQITQYPQGFYEEFVDVLCESLDLNRPLDEVNRLPVYFNFKNAHLTQPILNLSPSQAEFERYCQICVRQDVTMVSEIFSCCNAVLRQGKDNDSEKTQYYQQLMQDVFARGVDYATNGKHYQINIDRFLYQLLPLKLDYDQGKVLLFNHFINSRNLDYFSDAEKISMTHKHMRNEADKNRLLECLNVAWDNEQPGIETENCHITAIHLDKHANIYEHEFNHIEDFERYVTLVMEVISEKAADLELAEISYANHSSNGKRMTVFAQSHDEKENPVAIQMLTEVLYTALNLFKTHMKRNVDKLTNDVFVPANLGFDIDRLILNARLNQQLLVNDKDNENSSPSIKI